MRRFGHYKKGSRTEHELMNLFKSYGFLAIRAAGSGNVDDSPDILVFKRGIQYAIECKARELDILSISREQMQSLIKWEMETGILAYVAWRKKQQAWRFIRPSEMKENKKTYSIKWEKVRYIGRTIEELVEI